MTWDPDVYGRFANQRDRPFFELLARIDAQPRRIADLGCGQGHLTRHLKGRWPEAEVIGVDASAEMLAQAPSDVPHLRFEQADLATWTPPAPLDLIVSNAALHWVPHHAALLERLRGHLAPGGVLAIQVPYNHEAPSHRAVRAVAADPVWAGRFADLGQVHVLSPSEYLQVLERLGLDVDLWTTTYHHVLEGADAVSRWLEGTTLRPYLARLDPDDVPRFLSALRDQLRSAYPPRDGRVTFPFTRLFLVARADRASTPSKPRPA